MSLSTEEDGRRYQVVVNAAGQYSIWFALSQAPDGWTPTGTVGSKDECLANIEHVWTDMRPAPRLPAPRS